MIITMIGAWIRTFIIYKYKRKHPQDGIVIVILMIAETIFWFELILMILEVC